MLYGKIQDSSYNPEKDKYLVEFDWDTDKEITSPYIEYVNVKLEKLPENSNYNFHNVNSVCVMLEFSSNYISFDNVGEGFQWAVDLLREWYDEFDRIQSIVESIKKQVVLKKS